MQPQNAGLDDHTILMQVFDFFAAKSFRQYMPWEHSELAMYSGINPNHNFPLKPGNNSRRLVEVWPGKIAAPAGPIRTESSVHDKILHLMRTQNPGFVGNQSPSITLEIVASNDYVIGVIMGAPVNRSYIVSHNEGAQHVLGGWGDATGLLRSLFTTAANPMMGLPLPNLAIVLAFAIFVIEPARNEYLRRFMYHWGWDAPIIRKQNAMAVVLGLAQAYSQIMGILPAAPTFLIPTANPNGQGGLLNLNVFITAAAGFMEDGHSEDRHIMEVLTRIRLMDTTSNIDVISKIEAKLMGLYGANNDLNADEMLMARRIIRSCRYPVAHCLQDDKLMRPHNTIARVQQYLNLILDMPANDAYLIVERLLAKWEHLAAFWRIVVERGYTASYLEFMSRHLGEAPLAGPIHDQGRLVLACHNADALQHHAINVAEHIKNLKNLTLQSLLNGRVVPQLPLNGNQHFMADIAAVMIAIDGGIAVYGAIIRPPQPPQLPAPQGPGNQ